MTGMYFRVQRDNSWKNVELEYLTHEERYAILNDKSKDFLTGVIYVLCDNLLEIARS